MKIDDNTQPLPTAEELNQIPMPAGVDRRTFLMRSALLGAGYRSRAFGRGHGEGLRHFQSRGIEGNLI